MRLLELTLPTPAENLALDEALLMDAESRGAEAEYLRLWEPSDYFVVVGRGSRVKGEVRCAACRERGLPILRRSSGGAAIVAGPGCLMYATVLSSERRPRLKSISDIHCHVLSRLADSIRHLGHDVRVEGTSDLCLVQSDAAGHGEQRVLRKFSGNSLRLRPTHALYHGTIMYDFSLQQVSKFLHLPPRQPQYRNGREHVDFVANLPATVEELCQSVAAAWPCDGTLADWPRELTSQLVAEKYVREEWNVGT